MKNLNQVKSSGKILPGYYMSNSGILYKKTGDGYVRMSFENDDKAHWSGSIKLTCDGQRSRYSRIYLMMNSIPNITQNKATAYCNRYK